MKRGIITALQGHPMSGIMELIIRNNDTQEIETIPCESSTTLRALENAFEGAPYYKEIYYEVDESGILKGFRPIKRGTE